MEIFSHPLDKEVLRMRSPGKCCETLHMQNTIFISFQWQPSQILKHSERHNATPCPGLWVGSICIPWRILSLSPDLLIKVQGQLNKTTAGGPGSTLGKSRAQRLEEKVVSIIEKSWPGCVPKSRNKTPDHKQKDMEKGAKNTSRVERT